MSADVFRDLDRGRITRTQALVTFLSGMGGFVDGYDLLILSAAILLITPQFKLSAGAVGLLVASAYLGSFVGAIVSGYYTDLRGRRTIYIVDLGLFIVMSILSAVAPNYAWLIGTRFILGIAIGIDFPTAGAMIAEFSPAKRRGAMLSIWQLLWAVGAVVAPLVAIGLLPLGPNAWRWMLASGAIPALAVLLGRQFIPETPRWLAGQGRLEEAQRVVSWATRSDVAAAPIPTVEPTKPNFGEIFKGKYGRLTALISIICFAGAFGPLFLGSYSAYLAKFYGFTGNTKALLFGTVIWVFFIIGNLVNLLLTDRVGRKPMLIGGAVLVTVTLVIASQLHLSNIGLVFGVLVFAALGHWGGVDQGLWQYSVEVFPTRFRGTARGFTTSWIRMSAFLSALLTPVMLKSIGFGSTMLLFAAVELIVVVLSFFLPEVKGRRLEEIEAAEAAGGEPRGIVPEPS